LRAARECDARRDAVRGAVPDLYDALISDPFVRKNTVSTVSALHGSAPAFAAARAENDTARAAARLDLAAEADAMQRAAAAVLERLAAEKAERQSLRKRYRKTKVAKEGAAAGGDRTATRPKTRRRPTEGPLDRPGSPGKRPRFRTRRIDGTFAEVH